jgi:hypothetical protein
MFIKESIIVTSTLTLENKNCIDGGQYSYKDFKGIFVS